MNGASQVIDNTAHPRTKRGQTIQIAKYDMTTEQREWVERHNRAARTIIWPSVKAERRERERQEILREAKQAERVLLLQKPPKERKVTWADPLIL